jgi:hypothetical protein
MKQQPQAMLQHPAQPSCIDGLRVGRILRIDDAGRIFVDFPGNTGEAVPARCTRSAVTNSGTGLVSGREILLAFENGDPRRPIIVDSLHSLVEDLTEAAVVAEVPPREVTVDGQRVLLQAEHEIVLQCGKASITLTRAGKVLIKGEYVLSHATGENRVRGGSTAIN